MLERIADYVAGEIEARRVPGAALAVVQDGRVIWSRGFGVASIETGAPMTAETVFPVQSLTKVIAATAVMQLCEAEKLKLDDPANQHLGKVRIRNEWEDQNPVTVRQLLTHTSGLPNDVEAIPDTSRTVTLAEWVNSVAKTVRPPGGDIVYANWGYDALGPLIEHVSGERWESFVAQRILSPLSMNSTALGDVVPGSETATGHFLSAVDDELHTLKPVWPWQLVDTSGSMSSTAEEMGAFLAAHLSGGAPLLSNDIAAEMQQVHVNEGPTTSGMGLGWRVTRSNGRKLICHGGDGSGFTNFMGGYPELGLGIVLTLNRAGAAAARSVIANTVLRMLARDSGATERAPDDGLKRFEGAYESTYWNASAELTANGGDPVITVMDGLIVSDGGEPTRLTPIGGRLFAGDGGMLHGFEVALVEGEDGPAFAGGLYPFTFKRTGDVIAREELTPDESTVLAGHWRGTARTPLGPLLLEFEVTDEDQATVSTPFVRGLPLEECVAAKGLLSGRFPMTVPAAGDLVIHPRLVAVDGRLRGPVYAWGVFGEAIFPAELEKVQQTVQ